MKFLNSCFEDFYQKIIQTSTLLPSSSSSPTQTMIPHLNLFELLQQVLKMNTTMEKLLFVVLEVSSYLTATIGGLCV